MTMINIVNGNIFDAKEKYLAHQCNCISINAAHLALDVFAKYPYANVYKERKQKISHNQTIIKKDVPGTIKICGDGSKQRFIINCFAQYYPGTSKHSNDTFSLRERWFRYCLFEISKIEKLESIAFPFGIGCGAAGGDLKNYQALLERFAKYIKEKRNAEVVIYKYNK